MKSKILNAILLASVVALTACGGTAPTAPAAPEAAASEGAELKKIVVGATALPHAELLSLVVDDLKEKGIELDVKEFSDYLLLNSALEGGEIDANFFQHVPYLEQDNAKTGNKLVSIGGVHIEPMGAYSEKIDNIADLPEGATVTVPNDPSNEARALQLLEKNGLIKLKEGSAFTATPIDIVENNKKLVFKELDAAQLPLTLGDVDLSVINTNYALNAELVPSEDALIIEGKDSSYANVIVVREGDESRPEIVELLKAMQSDKIKNYLEEKYKDSIIPAF